MSLFGQLGGLQDIPARMGTNNGIHAIFLYHLPNRRDRGLAIGLVVIFDQADLFSVNPTASVDVLDRQPDPLLPHAAKQRGISCQRCIYADLDIWRIIPFFVWLYPNCLRAQLVFFIQIYCRQQRRRNHQDCRRKPAKP